MINFRVTEDGAMTVKPRDARIAVQQEFVEVGKLWHKKHRPRHFTLDAVRRYGYTPRKPSYNRRKRKKYGHTLPLVLSGASRAFSSTATIQAKRGPAVSITMPVRVFNFKPRGSAVNMLQEFRTIAPDEIKTYENQISRNLDRRIRRHRKQQERFG